MAKIHCGDYVKCPEGEGWVFACPADEKPGTLLITSTGDHLDSWFSCSTEEAVLSEPSEKQLLDLEFFKIRRKWLDYLK